MSSRHPRAYSRLALPADPWPEMTSNRAIRLAGPLAALAGVFGVLVCASPAAAWRAQPEPTARASVVGGAPAQLSAFASVAEILDLRGQEIGECTGTVVAPALILTAGHCAENMETGVLNKAAGYRVLTYDPTTGARVISAVTGVLVAERFSRGVDDRDAALLVLSAPIVAPPIKLAGEDGAASELAGVAGRGARSARGGASGLPAGLTGTIAGWGKTTFDQSRPTAELHSATTVVQRARWCQRNAPPFYKRSEICTIDPPGYSTGACNGDSGGPLLAPAASGEGYVEIGIVIHGYAHCSTRRPSVFTRIEAIAPWVQMWIAAYRSSPAAAPASPEAPATPEAPVTPGTTAPGEAPAAVPTTPGS